MYKKWVHFTAWALLFSTLIIIIKIAESSDDDMDHLTASVVQIAMESRIVSDEEGNIIYVSSSAAEIAGYNREELRGHNIEVLIPDRFVARHRIAYKQALRKANDTITEVQCFLLKKDQTERVVELRVRVLRSKVGKLVLVTITPVELIEKA